MKKAGRNTKICFKILEKMSRDTLANPPPPESVKYYLNHPLRFGSLLCQAGLSFAWLL